MPIGGRRQEDPVRRRFRGFSVEVRPHLRLFATYAYRNWLGLPWKPGLEKPGNGNYLRLHCVVGPAAPSRRRPNMADKSDMQYTAAAKKPFNLMEAVKRRMMMDPLVFICECDEDIAHFGTSLSSVPPAACSFGSHSGVSYPRLWSHGAVGRSHEPIDDAITCLLPALHRWSILWRAPLSW